MFTLILLAALVQPDVPQPDGPKSPVQSSTAPDQGLAVINDKGTLTITRLGYVESKEVWLKAPAKKDSEKVQVKTTVTSVQLEVVELPAHVVQAYTVDGKAIEAAKLGEMLAKDRTVLIALDGKKVEPFHLELYKEGTIVLVTPANLWDRGHGTYGLPGPQYLPDGRSGGYGSYPYYYPSTRYYDSPPEKVLPPMAK
jgi:hypothetical protein